MKKFLKILGVLIVIALIGGGFAFFFTRGMVNSAAEFFARISSGQLQEAYDGTSSQFKASIDIAQLQSFVENSSLDRFREASWGSRSFENNLGRLDGTVVLDDGSSMPMFLEFIKEDGEWKLFHIEKKKAGITTDDPMSVPEGTELAELIKGTTKEFTKSLDLKDMTSFRHYMSKLWRDQYTVEMLDEAYGSLYEMGVPWLSLENYKTVIPAAPVIDADGVLIVDGYYLTEPDNFVFTYKYIAEAGAWKVLGVHVRFKAP